MKLRILIGILLALISGPALANATAQEVVTGYWTLTPQPNCPVGPCFVQYGATSVSIGSFAPGGSYSTPLSVSSSSSRTPLPTGSAINVYNTGSNAAFIALGNGSVVATTSEDQVPAGGCLSLVVGSNTNIAAITASSTTTLNISGGSGLGTCGGGGGGSGGGGGTVTQGNAGTNAQAWWTRIGDATNGPAAVKAASTAAGTGDPSLVVALSPNTVPAVSQSGTWTVQPGNTANTTPWLATITQGGNTAAVVTANTATGTDKAMEVAVANANANGQTTMSASSPVALASNQSVADPCTFQAKTTYALSSNATTLTQLIAANGSQKIYICSISVISAAAQVFNLNTGTGSNCGTNTAAVIGSTTAANGLSFAANGGLTLGSGEATVAEANLAGAELCILQSNAVYSSGSISYVQQ